MIATVTWSGTASLKMRSIHKAWQSDRPMKKTTRRVRWYQNTTGNDNLSIRLKFDDQYGEINRFYDDRATATKVYEAFIAGEFTTWDLMQGYDPACEHDYAFDRSVSGRQHDGQDVTLDIVRCKKCGHEQAD